MKYFIFFLLMTTTVYSYPTPVDFDGKLLRWNKSVDNPTIYWEINVENPATEEILLGLVTDATSLWNNVSGSFINLQKVQGDDSPNITIEFVSESENSDVSSGFSIFDEFDGNEPSHCKIQVLLYGGLYNISKTILHELGHCLGLGHSLIPQSIMSYYLDKNSFGLDIDDRAAVSRLYPMNGETPILPSGCAILSEKGKRSDSIWIYYLIPLIFSFFPFAIRE